MGISLENVLKYEQPTKYIVNSENYSDDFSVPVLTAGKSFVLGYTDENEGLCKASENPVIIFDDFTADCKYVDFDFKVKSSAMKILHKINEEDNLRYYFYAMQAIDYTPFSHKRVWISEYSKFKIKKRSVAEQNVITKDLDNIVRAIDNANKRVYALDELVKSRFIEMFGDDSNPFNWEAVSVENVADIQVGVVLKPAQYYTDKENGIRAFRSLNIGENCIKDDNWVYFTEDGHKKNSKSILKENDLLIVRSGRPGTACVVTKAFEGCNAIDVIIARPNILKVNPTYLCMYTNMPHGRNQIEDGTGGIAQQHFNIGKYKKIQLFLPPMHKQNEFVEFKKLIDKSKFIVQKQIEDLQELLDSKMDEYFG